MISARPFFRFLTLTFTVASGNGAGTGFGAGFFSAAAAVAGRTRMAAARRDGRRRFTGRILLGGQGEGVVQHVQQNPRHDRPRLLRSEEHTSELQSRQYLVCRLLLEKKKK